MSEHVHEDSLLAFALGSGDPDVAEHVSKCSECANRSAEFSRLIETDSPSDPPAPLLEAFVREAGRVESERDEAQAEQFLRDPGEFKGTVTAGLLEIVIGRIDEEIDRSPIDALSLAKAAVDAAASLDEATYPQGVVSGIRGDAWKVRAYALRAESRYREAEECLDRAGEHYKETIASDFNLATVDYARSMIAQDAGRFDEAVALLERAREVFGRYGDTKRVAHAALLQGVIEFRGANYAAAADSFSRVAALNIDEPTTGASLLNQAHAVMHQGQYDFAAELCDKAETVFIKLGRSLEVVRARWCRGRLTLLVGTPSSAMTLLTAVRESFSDAAMAEEAGLATLDLVEAHLALEEYDDARSEAARAVELFRSVELSERTRVALAYLSDALARGGAHSGHARFVREFVDGALRGQTTEFAIPRSLSLAN